jgi:hypothetical protein
VLLVVHTAKSLQCMSLNSAMPLPLIHCTVDTYSFATVLISALLCADAASRMLLLHQADGLPCLCCSPVARPLYTQLSAFSSTDESYFVQITFPASACDKHHR